MQTAIDAPAGTSTVSAGRRSFAKQAYRVFSILLGPAFFPKRAAWATNGVSLKLALTIHLLASALTVVAAAELTLRSEELKSIASFSTNPTSTPMGRSLLISEYAEVALLCWLAAILLAIILAPWGALDERVRDSIRNSLRKTWLHSVQIGLAVCLAVGIVYPVVSYLVIWERNNPQPVFPQPPPRPGVSPRHPEFQARLRDHLVERERFENEYAAAQKRQVEWLRKRPWTMEHYRVVEALAWCGAILWTVITLMRSVGATRPHKKTAQSPMCDDCGYELTSLAMDGRCPECGLAVEASLGKLARLGAPWEHRDTTGHLSAWLTTAFMAIRRPSTLGRRLRIVPFAESHRVFTAIVVSLIFIAGLIAAEVLFKGVRGMIGTRRSFDDSVIMFTIAGSFYATTALLFICAVAMIVGGITSWRMGRNLLPIAMQASCYLTPMLLPWVFFSSLGILAVAWLGRHEYLVPLAQAFRLNQDIVGFSLYMLVNGLWAALYAAMIARATFAARFANK